MTRQLQEACESEAAGLTGDSNRLGLDRITAFLAVIALELQRLADAYEEVHK